MTGKDRSEQISRDITARIIEGLEKGVTPWEKPWRSNHRRAFNGYTGKPYRGMNPLILEMEQEAKQYSLNCWLTYHQVEQLGGRVKRYSKATPVVFFRPITTVKEDAEGNEETRIIRLLRFYFVFNIDQTEGLEKVREKYGKPVERSEIAVIEDAEKVITESGAVIEFQDVDRACYSPIADIVTLPLREQFKSQEGYYSTTFHELTHWTGHHSRLYRDLGNTFGSTGYAFEELVAELGGSFLCAHVGMPYNSQHADYIGNWIQVLKDDHLAIFKAAHQAQKALDFITKAQFEDPITAEVGLLGAII